MPEGQFVFLDTPGYYDSDKKSNLELQEITLSALDDSDLILYVTDMTRTPGKEEEILAGIVTKTQRPLFVALNKCDTLTEEHGDEADKIIAERRDFFLKTLNIPESHIFSISARTGDGIQELLKALMEAAPEGPMMYPEEYYTDQEGDIRISEIIREQVINRTQEERPH